ncbi:hypothetical protein EV651_122133 [Kribbella sp. VKM Ac-2571]|uniref:hypothetical protein n=1 Tax=Kribbella sp. VKM Ac-2571 TaxID=2512222 RepID=UPI00105F5E7A|nr:hypothetical protein [Kribbella sp. VKM Ac-2571]TDO49008.1 hypothetical protein EV651_122133 [Kribbella sp. VKM Ac-2571]
MNEEDLNEALHDVIVRSSPPPSMDPAHALEQARRVRKRRRATWAALAVVPLVVGVTAGPALVANFNGHRSVGQMVAGGPGTPSASPPSASAPPPVSTVAPTTAPKTRKTGDPWPEGQVDRTASTGPRADRAVKLMNDLTSSLPPGFTSPDLKYPGGDPMRWPQTQYASSDGEPDYWEYSASIPVQKDNRVGKLLVMSTTPNGKPATDPCTLAKKFWGGTGTCAVVDVGGKKVGVLTTKGNDSYDQWAAYRYDDGTVVYFAQAKKSDRTGRSPLTQPVFTGRQLAELAISPKFKIST